MLLIEPRFELMKRVLGTTIVLVNEPPFRTHSSQFTDGQYWFYTNVMVGDLIFPSSPLTFVALENGHVIGVQHGTAPGFADVVAFGDFKEIDGREPNMHPREMFNSEYHYKWFGEGQDTRSPVEKWGRLD